MKKLTFMVLLIFILSMTGCISEYRLSDEGTDVVAEYMAGILLEEDEKYEQSLLKEEELETVLTDMEETEVIITVTPTPTPVPEDLKAAGDSNEESGVDKNYTISEVMGITDFDIQYTGYELHGTYPEDDTNSYFSLTPREGNQLLVISFLIKNITGEAAEIDLSNTKVTDISYQLDINIGSIYKPQLALLENDLQFIDIEIEAEDTQTAVLIFEISKDIDMTDINLIISKDSKAGIIEIK